MDLSIIPFGFVASMCSAISGFCLFLGVIGLLEQIEMEREAKKETKSIPIMIKLAIPFTPNLRSFIENDAFLSMRNNTQNMILMAGYDQTLTPDQFIAAKIILGGFGFICMLLAFSVSQPLMGFLVFLCLIGYPTIWLRNTVKRRHLEIQKALPTVLDLLTLSIEAGKDFITALRDILGRRRIDALGEELGRTLQEIQLGKQRRHALRDLAKRVQQSDLTSVINAIIQADELGVSIGQLLRIQGDMLRTKRFQRAEKLANEAPVKILFPVIIFIFPSVIVMLMAPIILQAFKAFAH